MENEYPRYHQLKYQLPFADLQQVKQHIIGDQEILLSFTDLNHTVLCIGISSEGNFFMKLNMPRPLQEWIPLLKHHLQERSAEYYPLAHQLYQALLAPIRTKWQGKNLVVIPDGQIWHIPFNALPVTSTGKGGYQQRFLIQEVGVRWLHAAHRTLLDQAQNTSVVRYHWVGFAPFEEALQVDETSPQVLPALPGSISEIQAIAARLAEKGLAAQVLLSNDANRDNFQILAKQTQVLHLSTHAFSNTQEPLLSSLYFHEGRTVHRRANALFGSETATLTIPAELVILSACETQAGRLEGGEGIAGWAQSFSMAGTKGLLASAWSVNDDTGPKLMKAYFRHLLAGKGKASAYQAAQQAYLKHCDPLTLHPYFWGGFVYIGSNDPLAWQTDVKTKSPKVLI